MEVVVVVQTVVVVEVPFSRRLPGRRIDPDFLAGFI